MTIKSIKINYSILTLTFFCPQSLCCEIKQRRRGVGSVLRLCQHLLDDQDTCSLNADHQSMQLIIVNLERRWEAIIMQAVQWQTRLQKKLAKHPVSDTCLTYPPPSHPFPLDLLFHYLNFSYYVIARYNRSQIICFWSFFS